MISWSSAAGASYYQVSVDGNIISTVDNNVTSLPVPQLRPGTRYTLSVTVYDSDDLRGNTVQAHVMTGNVLFINFDLTAYYPGMARDCTAVRGSIWHGMAMAFVGLLMRFVHIW